MPKPTATAAGSRRSACARRARLAHLAFRPRRSALEFPRFDQARRSARLVVDDLELLAQAFDVAVDGAVVDINLVVIGRIHQGVAAFHDAGAGGERL